MGRSRSGSAVLNIPSSQSSFGGTAKQLFAQPGLDAAPKGTCTTAFLFGEQLGTHGTAPALMHEYVSYVRQSSMPSRRMSLVLPAVSIEDSSQPLSMHSRKDEAQVMRVPSSRRSSGHSISRNSSRRRSAGQLQQESFIGLDGHVMRTPSHSGQRGRDPASTAINQKPGNKLIAFLSCNFCKVNEPEPVPVAPVVKSQGQPKGIMKVVPPDSQPPLRPGRRRSSVEFATVGMQREAISDLPSGDLSYDRAGIDSLGLGVATDTTSLNGAAAAPGSMSGDSQQKQQEQEPQQQEQEPQQQQQQQRQAVPMVLSDGCVCVWWRKNVMFRHMPNW